MEYASYIIKFLYRIKWWLVFGPLIIALIVIYKTRDMSRSYEVKTTIYTGVMSGFNFDQDGSVQTVNIVNNTMENILSIITAKSTLRHVSMRLFAQHMMHGDAKKDNNYILAKNYRHLQAITPQEVKALIDKKSEEKTLEKLFAYADANTDNFLYGLFNWSPPYYSYNALSQIKVNRIGNSDMVEIKYTADDPGIAYHTLELLNEEFMNQYEAIRYGQSDRIIHFFEIELEKTGKKLKSSEDSLTNYNIEKRIINYDEQTKHLAALSRDFELQYEEILLDYNSSQALVKDLEERIGEKAQLMKKNSNFIEKLNQISSLSAQIVKIETFGGDSTILGNLDSYKKLLRQKEENFKAFSDSLNFKKYTKESYAGVDLLGQWVSELLKLEEAKSKLNEMERWKDDLDDQYVYYSPIGSTIKRKEREINVTEATYLEILHSLNVARLRQKSLQMTSATLKVLNPPTFPLGSAPTKRKFIVIVSFLGSFFFILTYFLIIELFDRTLRDKYRTERMTNGKVLGAFPKESNVKGRYSKEIKRIATENLANSLLPFFKTEQTNVINVLSAEQYEGKSFISAELEKHYKSIGFNTRTISWHSDFSPNTKDFLWAENFNQLITNDEIKETDLLIIEYPPLNNYSIPQNLLKKSNINLFIARATRTWKDTDRTLFQRIKEQSSPSPFFIILNKTRKEAAEYFTGLLPPYTFLRKLIYRFLQLGLTANEITKKRYEWK